jgi:hypothetical protein
MDNNFVCASNVCLGCLVEVKYVELGDGVYHLRCVDKGMG